MRIIIYCLLAICNLNLYAQFDSGHVITTNIEYPFMTITGDVDGDGDMDVLYSGGHDDKILWFENLDGIGNFGPEQLIQSNSEASTGIVMADVDDDNDLDLIAVYLTGDKVSWFENTDGQGTFSNEIFIADDLNGAVFVLAEDLDNDDDADIVVSSGFGDKITWNENLDGQGTFSDNIIITTYVDYPREIGAADLDGDSDLDVFSVDIAGKKVAWYENLDGAATFGAQQVITDEENLIGTIIATDIDGDDDLDLVIANSTTDNIGWFENIDGQGNFSGFIEVTNYLDTALTIIAFDVDLDNDIDIVAPAYFDNKVVWFENIDGNGNYAAEQIITNVTNPQRVYASDIDLDGAEDLLIQCDGGQIIWHKNLSLLSVAENTFTALKLFPNPAKDELIIQYPETLIAIEITNQLGQTVATYTNQSSIAIDNLAPGLYYVTVEDENGWRGTQKMVKE